ncbi:MAG: hypothetical protein IKI45_11200 [Oscillospiraceae bacterium]|nr:hypothetical protein [Oscillospiraceae bacterium]
MSTSFDVITKSDKVPTVKELTDALFALPQFARTGIRMDEIEVQLRDQDGILPPEQYSDIPLDRVWSFVLKSEDSIYFISYRTQRTDDENWWVIESRALQDAGRALYVAIPCALAKLTNGLTGSADSAWHNGRDDYTGAEMWDEFVQTELPYCFAKKPFFCPVLNAELIVEGGGQWGRKVTEPYMRRCQNVLLNMPDSLLDAICGAAKKYWLRTKNRKETNAVRPVLMTEDLPAGEILQYIHFDTLELYTPKDESQIGFGLFGECDWEKGREIEAVILDGRLIYFGVYMMSPWEYDKCREEFIEECGSAESFDRSNYAL